LSIKGYHKDKFKKQLKEYLSASGPIRSIEHLFGREKEMALIDEALSAEGRNVFIYGDRGVGKSSLAAAAASQYQSADNEYIQIGCGPDTEFYKTIEDLADRVIKKASGQRNYDVTQALDVKFYSVKWNKREENVVIPKVNSIYTAVEAIVEVVKFHSEAPIIIIDEFDQIESEKERKLFATYLKSLGDRGVNIKFIITGVAQSLKQLLADHGSGFRQLDTINLERLYWGPRETIVTAAIKSFNLTIEHEVVHTIAKISNGFPYFVHLLTEKVLWSTFNDEHEINHIDADLFNIALEKAISSIGAHLQTPYDAATLHRTNDYREILWATADSESTIRYIDGMFKSYLRIHKKLYGINPKAESRPLSKKSFSARLGNLKKEQYGTVLENVADKKGLYSYRENILRGFVAMKALGLGIELQGDVPDEPKPIAMAKETRQSYVGKDYTPKIKFRGEK
tara:strand:+ start:99969 stop:101330 length:1362 start_codon:yes stop_codon:yes gene_type:complete